MLKWLNSSFCYADLCSRRQSCDRPPLQALQFGKVLTMLFMYFSMVLHDTVFESYAYSAICHTRNLLCVYSKKHMNDVPELAEMKKRANTRSLKEMARLLRYSMYTFSLGFKLNIFSTNMRVVISLWVNIWFPFFLFKVTYRTFSEIKLWTFTSLLMFLLIVLFLLNFSDTLLCISHILRNPYFYHCKKNKV